MENLLLGKLASLLSPNSAGAAPEILTEASLEYNVKRQVNNTKFQFKPSAIVMVETTKQVAEIMRFANRFPAAITLRVRSGGHDHEGECSGTDTLLIDFSKMKTVEVWWQTSVEAVDSERSPTVQPGWQPIVSVQPGARFQHIKPKLDEKGIGIAHGTCETVGIAGYTMGGGWGPWTRRYGMGCERLIGATIVLGNGDIKTLRLDAPKESDEARLLWALRGGGGMSYGIVTELQFAAFNLPKNLCSFNLNCLKAWPERTALDILKCWEDAITDIKNTHLIGTNLKIVAINLPENKAPDPKAVLECTFNGYFDGTEAQARKMIKQYFDKEDFPCKEALQKLVVQVHYPIQSKAGVSREQWHFDSWDREVPSKVTLLKALADIASVAKATPSVKTEQKIREGIALEADGPAPHKITSRLVNASGWDDEGRKALICSLQSPMVPTLKDLEGNIPIENDYVLKCYITLGAIVGPFYAACDDKCEKFSAFPYKDRRYTIQYQAWWNQYLDTQGLPKKSLKNVGTSDPNNNMSAIIDDELANRKWVNRAEDWIEACRDYVIPHTSGAFISFKDSSVRTATYFADSYQGLVKVKQNCSQDKYVLLRSRKTII